MNVADIQQALMDKGFDPGVVDGVWGRRTAGAVRAFQGNRGLQVDGVVGPITTKALFGEARENANPLENLSVVWFQEAWRLRGVKERPGVESNPLILQWADAAGIPYRGDDIPWCGLFAAHCIGATLTDEPLPNEPLAARSWLKFGASCEARTGAVAVFWREDPKGWQGHVGFYAGEDDDAYHVLGGNQSDEVSVARIAKDRLLQFRWPATVPIGGGGAVRVALDGVLSTHQQ